ncbi:hypothetical protein [Winogradskyella pulchriflava]|uniref:Phage abortive infection protein n=1 Tax=Winogradskyella pulchriflava TaxID=1110688 RepID=A0ABV6QBL1_9FLAO
MKLFNKIRYRLLKGKQLTNYLVYAFGEIILVVIGILIALWINNWNNDRQIANINRNLQEKVLVQLDRDIATVDYFRKELDTLDQVYLKYLEREYDENKAAGKNVFSMILFEVTELGLDEHIVNWVDNAKLDDTKASEKLIDLSGTYKLYFKNISDIERIIYDKITSNLEILEKTQPWYSELITDFSCKTDCVKYLLEDENHKARIASLRFIYIKAYGDIVNGFYYDLQSAKKDLKAKMGVATE